MATFDSSKYDIPTLVAKLRDQRFDGYQPEQLAQVVEKFRDGAGTTSITDAVAALKSISGALADTEQALQAQLKALGVEWQSQAGGQASTVVAQHAGFSGVATAKVEQAAQMMFEQAEAFTRTRNKLPAPEDLRKAGGYNFGDTVFSLFGFETDHAADVRTAEEAKAQAVDALNAYAHDSGHYLGSTSTVEAPQPVEQVSAPGTGVTAGIGGPIAPVPTLPDTAPTQAQGTKDVAPAPLRGPVADTPTPPIGIPAAAPHMTAPSAVTPIAGVAGPAPSGPADHTGASPVGGQPSPARQPGRGGQPPAEQVSRGGQPGSAAQTGRGPSAAARSTASVPLGGAVTGGAVTGGGVAGRGIESGPVSRAVPPSAAEALAKGKVAGAMPPTPTTASTAGPGFAAVRAAGGVGGLAEAGPALGAAGAGGAVSGEPERPGRAPGKGTAGARLHQIPVGDLPEEEEARLARRGGHTPDSAHTRSILEPAAPRDGEEDAEPVRRFGVDDNDLFSDRRGVAPGTIGEHDVP